LEAIKLAHMLNKTLITIIFILIISFNLKAEELSKPENKLKESDLSNKNEKSKQDNLDAKTSIVSPIDNTNIINLQLNLEKSSKINEANLSNLIQRSQILYDENNIEAAELLLLEISEYATIKQIHDVNVFSLLKLGNIKFNLAQKVESAKYYYEAINISLSNNVEQYLGILYTKLSYLYFSSDLSFAKTYLELAILQHEKQQDFAPLAESYYNLTLIYKKLGLLEKAKEANKYFENFFKQAGKPYIYKLSSNIDDNNDNKISFAKNKNHIEANYAYIQILNKIDGFTYLFENKIGSKIKFKTIEIITKSCLKSAPQNLPENLLLSEIIEHDEISKTIFNGWMFSSSPSLNSLEHPIYDIKILNCVTNTI
jgi:hypothetical protein